MGGYFGTSCARRHERTPDPEIGATIPQTAECARCDTVVILADGKLPRGWLMVDGGAICPDCAEETTRSGKAAAGEELRRALDRQASAASIGPDEPSRFRGCRIGHEIALGMAGLELRAGSTPPEGRDERIRFMLDGQELDLLIIELSTIRGKLTASQTPGTAAREGRL